MSAENIHEFKKTEDFISDVDHTDFSSRDRTGHVEQLAAIFADKGIDGAAVRYLAGGNAYGEVLDAYYLGNVRIDAGDDISQRQTPAYLAALATKAAGRIDHKVPSYTGTIHENRVISSPNYGAGNTRSSLLRDYRRNGASRRFETGHVTLDENTSYEQLTSTPMAIVGAGAAGILTARALYQMGFTNVDVIDRRGESGGIWQQPNVQDGSKNNPFELTYDDVHASSAAQTSFLQQSGRHIARYIDTVAQKSRSGNIYSPTTQLPIKITKGLVREIEPGDLEHHVRLTTDRNEEVREYPIVIYAPGLGKPLPVSSPGRMTSDASRGETGIRWQQQLSYEKLLALEGKRLIFIGLGNSTAEMVTQIQDFESRYGRQIDYRILTHYPNEMLETPDEPYGDYGQIYRNINKPELTKLAGDLRTVNQMFSTAVDERKVIGGVTKWNVDRGRITVDDMDGIQTSIPYDQLYTLIGYGQEAQSLQDVGITAVDAHSGSAALDYDGEVQQTPGETGRSRLHPGYFAIGPIAKNRFNPNAIVIPGIQYQLNEMLPTILARAAEFAVRKPAKLAEAHATKTRQDTLPGLASLAVANTLR